MWYEYIFLRSISAIISTFAIFRRTIECYKTKIDLLFYWRLILLTVSWLNLRNYCRSNKCECFYNKTTSILFLLRRDEQEKVATYKIRTLDNNKLDIFWYFTRMLLNVYTRKSTNVNRNIANILILYYI